MICLKICIKDTDTQYYLLSYSKTSNCSDDCFKTDMKLDINNKKCLDSCLKSNYYHYEYENICYNECPKGTLMNGYLCEDNECEADNQNLIECLDKTPQGYYLDIEDGIYKKCFENCIFCYGEGNRENHNCKVCISNFTFLNETKFKNNCFTKCEYYYYFNETYDYYYCTEDFQCPKEFNKLVIYKNKCIDDCKKDDSYQYEYNKTCYEKCPDETYLLEDNNDNICYDKAIDGYYLDKENETFKRCYETCYNCDEKGNKTINNCLECKTNYTVYNNSKNTIFFNINYKMFK